MCSMTIDGHEVICFPEWCQYDPHPQSFIDPWNKYPPVLVSLDRLCLVNYRSLKSFGVSLK